MTSHRQIGPFKVLDSRTVYKNPWIHVREDKVIRPGGSDGIFGVVEMVGGSSIVAIDSSGDVFLTKEFKYGVERESTEVISGAIDDGESPLEAAKREIKEELGLTAKTWHELGVVDPFTTVISSPNYMFLAMDLEKTEASPDEGEMIELVKVPFEKAVRMVIDGDITHSASCVSILKSKLIIESR